MGIRFLDFDLNLATQELSRNGEAVHLQRKAFDVLNYLVTHRDRVVPGAELMEEVWRGATVTEASLTRAVRAVRKALGDDGNAQRVVSTARGKGYRFIAEVAGAAAEKAAPAPAPRHTEGASYAGQSDLQYALTVTLDNLSQGAGATVLLSGEAGIGKSRAVREWLFAGRRSGIEAHTAWCHGGSKAEGAAYRVWLQLLEEVIRSRSESDLRGYLGTQGSELVAFIPSLGRALPDIKPITRPEGPGLPYSLFQAISGFLRRAALEQPLMLILEDLHWADQGSAALLEFLAHDVRGAPFVLVATFRPNEILLAPQLAGIVERTQRLDRCHHHEIRPLLADEILKMVEDRTPEIASPAFAELLAKRTRGNPLFVEEILRSFDERGITGDPARLVNEFPRGLRSLARRRVSLLEPPGPSLLQWAAVIGGRFDIPVLSRLSELDESTVALALEQAVSAEILSPSVTTQPNFQFSHDLLREAIYEELPPLHRAKLHQQVGTLLESLRPEAADDWAETLAHHFAEAQTQGEEQKALEYAIEAGLCASKAGAADRTSRYLRRAFALMDDGVGEITEVERFELHLACVTAERELGDFEPAQELAGQALEIARGKLDALAVARAALCFAGHRAPLQTEETVQQTALVDSLKALEDVAPQGQELRALTLARLAASGLRHAPQSKVTELRSSAIQCARNLPKIRTLGEVILTQFAATLWGLPFEQRLQVADECLERSLLEADRFSEVAARRARMEHYIESGRFSDIMPEIEAAEILARSGGDPQILFATQCLRTTISMARGDFEDAERSLHESAALSQRYHVAGGGNFYGLQMIELRTHQGRFEEVRVPLEPFAPWSAPEAAFLARTYGEMGRTSDALVILNEACPKLPPHHDNEQTFFGVAQLSRAAALCDAKDHAETLFPLVAHFRGRIFHRILWAAHGTAEFHMGILATTLERYDDAWEFLEEALQRNTALAARSWISETHLARARLCLERGAAGDQDLAFKEAGRALELASSMGQAGVVRAAESLVETLRHTG